MVNRSRKEGATSRRIRKVLGKTNWYKIRKKSREEKRRNGKTGPPIIKESKNCSKKSVGDKPRETEAVMFVPCTPGGLLQKWIQETEDRFTEGTKLKRIRVVERGGGNKTQGLTECRRSLDKK